MLLSPKNFIFSLEILSGQLIIWGSEKLLDISTPFRKSRNLPGRLGKSQKAELQTDSQAVSF